MSDDEASADRVLELDSENYSSSDAGLAINEKYKISARS